MADVSTLTVSVQHIVAIVEAQQQYATRTQMIEPVAVDRLVDDAVHLCERAVRHKELRFARMSRSRCRRSSLIKRRLLEVLVNLITNSRESFCEVRPEQPFINIVARRRFDDRVRIEVIDNGGGIAPENLIQLFREGFTTKTDGHGFGLHFCDFALKEMSGSISARSEGVGQGACSSLTCPAAPRVLRRRATYPAIRPNTIPSPKQFALRAEGAAMEDKSVNRRVLIVDDQQIIHDAFNTVFTALSLTTSGLDDLEASLFGESTTTLPASTTSELDHAYQGEEGYGKVVESRQQGTPYALHLSTCGCHRVGTAWKPLPSCSSRMTKSNLSCAPPTPTTRGVRFSRTSDIPTGCCFSRSHLRRKKLINWRLHNREVSALTRLSPPTAQLRNQTSCCAARLRSVAAHN